MSTSSPATAGTRLSSLHQLRTAAGIRNVSNVWKELFPRAVPFSFLSLDILQSQARLLKPDVPHGAGAPPGGSAGPGRVGKCPRPPPSPPSPPSLHPFHPLHPIPAPPWPSRPSGSSPSPSPLRCPQRAMPGSPAARGCGSLGRVQL